MWKCSNTFDKKAMHTETASKVSLNTASVSRKASAEEPCTEPRESYYKHCYVM